jgi:hypothetical protein
MTDEDRFPPDDAAAVMRHMNHDHTGDALLIVQAFGGEPEATAAVVEDLDKLGIVFDATVGTEHRSVRVPWSTRLEERPQLRPEIAQMYRNACAELGIPARGEQEH